MQQLNKEELIHLLHKTERTQCPHQELIIMEAPQHILHSNKVHIILADSLELTLHEEEKDILQEEHFLLHSLAILEVTQWAL